MSGRSTGKTGKPSVPSTGPAPLIGSLCSGYGGLDIAVEAVFGAIPAWFCEYDRDPSTILAHHWPDAPNHGDVWHTDWAAVEPVDILTAGYPCQPFSHAGKRKGADDPRHLWPGVARAIGALRPRLVVLENVAGHVSLGLADVLGDLSALGYDATWGVVRAADAGAPHGRARIFIVAAADAAHLGHERGGRAWDRRPGPADSAVAAPDSRRDGHGPGQDAGGVGRLDRPDAPRAWEWERARAVAGDRGAAPPADAHGHGQGPQGGEPAGRCDMPAWGAVPDAAGDGRDERRPEPAGLIGRPDAAIRCAADCQRNADWITPDGVDYGPAVRRWHDLFRCVPGPAEPGRKGRRLSPRFVEWMQGLDAGHVTDPAIGLSRNAQLKALGNGVVPQQAALAIRTLLAIHAAEETAA